ncbi:InlB B-repeat-containing protein [Bifidobacterium sp. B4081]|uniref:RCC1 domain-containing protein n=1 Tax=unclassified Bifidobacterium TaxID=2608897 RepID=UPI002269DC8A|nr:MULTISPECIES: InlB B-repeat-containing protein [unclassified Bifidobacterium]MCX8645685.1 InlB B-repeat-containing protein [Bifidobacterium sp. B4081]MCX8668377.1 InlB B-repeat-containing protein [Bifidobacterium sp. B3998]
MVRFDPGDGSKPIQTTVKTGTLAAPLHQNPGRGGFRFDGWTLDGQPFDFRTPILQDTTLKAKWTTTTDWTLSPGHGPAAGTRLAISPPGRQEPCYTSIQAAGEQATGLTGDGRIRTWTQDGTPEQAPLPAQAPQGLRYLQAAAGSRRQAALGSDQRIYTRDSQQSTPAVLDTGQDTGFTSISMDDDLLLAVDRQGRVHAFQDSRAGSRKPPEQATASLPGQAQAVTAAASGGRILALDADGQAWAWDKADTGSIKPERIKQDPGTRLIQAQALSTGFLLLDADGQARYLADGTTSPAAVSLPEGAQASQINTNQDQAIITGKDGHVWAWKPGQAPMRADDGSRAYVQAASINGRIAAISRQGDLYGWSLDKQGQPGKPAGITTTQAPSLESASMDGQPLKLSKNNDAWQTDIPARKPGQAAILITGSQDGQPFTRSLNYTVDQTMTRENKQGTTHTVTFNAGGGSPEPADQYFSTPNSRVKRPSPDPTRQGYQFDGWFTGSIAYDFSKPVDKGLTLTAHWTPESRNDTWSISPDKGSQLGGGSTTITPPDRASQGIRFNQVSGTKDFSGFSLAVGSDGNAYAWGYNSSGQLGDGTTTNRTTPVMVRKPDPKTYPDLPADFTYVQVSAGSAHSLALGSDGYTYAWGNNGDGQLGNNSISSSTVPVRVRDPASPADASKGLQATQVSAGNYHSLAVGSDGYAYAWGYNNSGQIGNNTSSDSHVPVRVRDPASPNDPSKGLQATQVSAGGWHSLAVGSDGYAYAWGSNHYGQLGINTSNDYVNPAPVRVRDPASPSDPSKGLQATQVSAGGAHTLAVGSDGYAYAWGYNHYGQLGNNTTSDYDPNPAPVRVRDPASPNDASKGLQATQVSAGVWHSLAVGSDGCTYAWGRNYDSQLGNNSIPASSHSAVPVPVSFSLQPVIAGVRFDQTPVSGLMHGEGGSVSVAAPAHAPGTVTVSVDYTLGGAGSILTDKSLSYTYTPLGVLPRAGGEGILLALATGMTGMGGVMASRRHRWEARQLLHASHE